MSYLCSFMHTKQNHVREEKKSLRKNYVGTASSQNSPHILEHERPSRWPCVGAARAGRFPWVLVNGDLADHHYVRGHDRAAGHTQRDFEKVGAVRAAGLDDLTITVGAPRA